MSDRAPRVLTYLGPQGSFTHAAVELLSQPWTGPVSARGSVPDVIFSVESGEAAAGIVPLETSVEGDVTSTVDELIFRSATSFINEVVVVPVTYVIAGQANARWGGVRRLITTSGALAQCRRFVEAAGVETQLVASVDDACRVAAESADEQVAALTTAMAAHLHSLAVMRTSVEDHSGVMTRMALFSRRVCAATGHDETIVVITPIGDRTGVLADILLCFSDRGIALTAISSRPLRTRLGEYCFSLTARSHISDTRLRDALQACADLPAEVKLLGSFPSRSVAADRVDESAPPGSVGADGLQGWIDTVLRPEQLGL